MTKREKLAENIILMEKDGQKFILPETVDGRYEIADILSSNSGFGLVLTAYDKNVFGRKVLIKVRNYKGKVKPGNLDNKRIIEQARKETRIEVGTLSLIRQINIPNTPVIRDIVYGYYPGFLWSEDGKISSEASPELQEYIYNEPYIVLQYIEGETLKDYFAKIKATTKLSSLEWQKTVLEVAKQILKMLRKLYRVGEKHPKIEKIIYQDLKLENIIVTPSGNFALIDFGGCGLILKDGTTVNLGEIYTPGYKAPELLIPNAKKLVSEKLDIYTLGVVMYILLTGIQMTTSNVDKGMLKIDYSLLNVIPSVKEIIVRATELDVEKRADVDELLEMIFTALKDIANS